MINGREIFKEQIFLWDIMGLVGVKFLGAGDKEVGE